ncbi:MAG: cobalamin-dependent protein, partial [Candidatus Odinarchaeota archaeon]
MILLINPRTSKPSEVHTKYFREPNLGLLYLAAILDLDNIPVDILDLEQFIELNENELEDLIKNKITNYKIFGITSLTNTFHLALNIARIIKNQDKENYVILGGPHVSFMYKEILKHDKKMENLIDYICIGEAENSFLELIRILITDLQYEKKVSI